MTPLDGAPFRNREIPIAWRPCLRARIESVLADLGREGARAWIPQPDAAQALVVGCPAPAADQGAEPDSHGPGVRVELTPPGQERLVEQLLTATRSVWELELRECASRLTVARAVHQLSNSLTPLLCAETAESLMEDERTRIGGRTATLRKLVRGSQGTLPLRAEPFLNEIRSAVEGAGVELQISRAPGVESAALAPDHELLRVRLIEVLIAAWQAGAREAPLDLSIAPAAEGLLIRVVVPPETLVPSWMCAAVSFQRSEEALTLELLLPRPWLAWIGPAPANTAGLRSMGFDLVVLENFAELERVLARARPALFPRPCGVAAALPQPEQAQLRRQVLALDLELGRATHPAKTWPSLVGEERIDLGAWCRTAAALC